MDRRVDFGTNMASVSRCAWASWIRSPRAAVGFCGLDPNPVSASVLMRWAKPFRASGAMFGVAHDPDADRFALVDGWWLPCSRNKFA